tara:strand:- start:2121 stop:2492 length:372 start_codon:yes stop_codon:yes gene_type:complete
LGISGERENRPVLHIAQLRTDTAPNEGDYAYIFSVLRKMFGKFPLTDIQIYDVRSKKKSNFNNDISRPPSSVSKLITASKVECMDQEEMNNVLYGLMHGICELKASGYRLTRRAKKTTMDLFG